MKQLTLDEQVCNLILAAWRWHETPPEQVVEGLGMWQCGATACFGGYVPSWPEFQAQGVESFLGMPIIKIDALNNISGYALAIHLFRDANLFTPRKGAEADGTDHEVVAQRLDRAFEKLMDQLEYTS